MVSRSKRAFLGGLLATAFFLLTFTWVCRTSLGGEKKEPPPPTKADPKTEVKADPKVDVDGVLENVCPNCGGGFVPRPVRPSRNWKGDNFLGKDPASTQVKHRPVDPASHARFVAAIKILPPHKR